MPTFPTNTFSKAECSIINTISCFKGFYALNKLRIRYPKFAGGSHEVDFERLEHPGAVCVLPYDPLKKSVLLIEQFRVGPVGTSSNPWLFETVAGLIEPGETLETTAVREMQEEAQLPVLDLIPLFNCWLTPGCSSERAWFFCGRVDLSSVKQWGGLSADNEDIKLHVIDCETAFAAINNGNITNAFAILALQWLQINQSMVDKKWL